MSNKPLVSIVTASYNSSSHIRETYKSLCDQCYRNWEWLVTDDFSTDDSCELIQSFCKLDSRVKLYRTSVNSGAATARNISISHASGELIAFIDSDDLWLNNKLSNQVSFMSDTINFSFTPYYICNESGIKSGKIVDCNDISSVCYIDMLKKAATLGCSTVMLRRSAFPEISMPLIRTGQDYALWLRLLKSGDIAYKLNIPLTCYRVRSGSISRNKFKKAKRQWEIYRSLEKLSLHRAAYCFIFYAWRAVFRR